MVCINKIFKNYQPDKVDDLESTQIFYFKNGYIRIRIIMDLGIDNIIVEYPSGGPNHSTIRKGYSYYVLPAQKLDEVISMLFEETTKLHTSTYIGKKICRKLRYMKFTDYIFRILEG